MDLNGEIRSQLAVVTVFTGFFLTIIVIVTVRRLLAVMVDFFLRKLAGR